MAKGHLLFVKECRRNLEEGSPIDDSENRALPGSQIPYSAAANHRMSCLPFVTELQSFECKPKVYLDIKNIILIQFRSLLEETPLGGI
jgi:hypothetical protein